MLSKSKYLYFGLTLCLCGLYRLWHADQKFIRVCTYGTLVYIRIINSQMNSLSLFLENEFLQTRVERTFCLQPATNAKHQVLIYSHD